MYAILRTYRDVTDQAAGEAVRRSVEGLIPTLRQQEGFLSYFVARCEDSTLRSLTCFKNEEQSHKAQHIVREWVVTNLSQLLTGHSSVYRGRVTQPRATPTVVGASSTIGPETYFNLALVENVGPKEVVAPLARQHIIPVALRHCKGLFTFRNEGGLESQMISVALCKNRDEAVTMREKVWEAMCSKMSEHYRTKPACTGGQVLYGVCQSIAPPRNVQIKKNVLVEGHQPTEPATQPIA